MITYPFLPFPTAILDSDGAFSSLSAASKLTLAQLIRLQSIAQWYEPPQIDAHGVYVIYAASQVAKLTGCKKDKAYKILRELEDAGYIHRVHQGQGKPDKIYVNKLDLGSIQIQTSNTNLPQITPEECYNHLSTQIDFENLAAEFGGDRIDGIVSIIVNTLQSLNPTLTIGSSMYDMAYCRQRLLATTEDHIRYVIRRLDSYDKPLYAPSAYILARLWDAYASTNSFTNSGQNFQSTGCRWSLEEIESIRRMVEEP